MKSKPIAKPATKSKSVTRQSSAENLPVKKQKAATVKGGGVRVRF